MDYSLAQVGKVSLYRSFHAGHVPPRLGHVTAERLKRPVMAHDRLRHLRQQLVDRAKINAVPAHQCPKSCTISSVIFFASPNSIIVLGRKNSSLSTPA